MANILRQGKTPYWGTWKSESTFGDFQKGVIIDSFNSNVEIKDYEQTDENGAVCGYLIYDQTVGFDMSGTLLTNTCYSGFNVGKSLTMTCNEALSVLPFIGYDHNKGGGYYTMGINTNINTPNIAIIKSASFNTSAGGAATFSLSGTAYSFGGNVTCQE